MNQKREPTDMMALFSRLSLTPGIQQKASPGEHRHLITPLSIATTAIWTATPIITSTA